ERPPSPARLSRRPPSGRRGLPPDGGGAHADDRRILATLPFEVGVPPEGPNGFLALRPIVERAARSHVLGFAVVLGVALLLHYGLLPAPGAPCRDSRNPRVLPGGRVGPGGPLADSRVLPGPRPRRLWGPSEALRQGRRLRAAARLRADPAPRHPPDVRRAVRD